MIKGGRLPGCRIMALRTRLTELIRLMIRICGSGIIALVTCVARGGSSRVLSIGMALRTACCCMRSRQLEGCQIVVEIGGLPAAGRVTCGTSVTVLPRCMIGIRGSAKIRLVAAVTILRRPGVLTVHVTLGAAD